MVKQNVGLVHRKLRRRSSSGCVTGDDNHFCRSYPDHCVLYNGRPSLRSYSAWFFCSVAEEGYRLECRESPLPPELTTGQSRPPASITTVDHSSGITDELRHFCSGQNRLTSRLTRSPSPRVSIGSGTEGRQPPNMNRSYHRLCVVTG